MKSLDGYNDFILAEGISGLEYRGTNKTVLTVPDALKALELLHDTDAIVLGGDIVSKENDRLDYAMYIWGNEYHYLNWHCERAPLEKDASYATYSIKIAETAIQRAQKVANELKKDCYILFVISK